MRHGLTIAALLLCVPACKKDAPPEPTSVASAQTPVTKPAPSIAKVPPSPSARVSGGVLWTDPPGWTRDPSTKSSMRVATLKVPRAKGDEADGELAVFYFGPGGAGGVDANVSRWTKQFKDLDPKAVKRSDRTANGLEQHIVEVERGTYETKMPGASSGALEGYGMLAAIVQSSAGPYFFKLTGPSSTVSTARATFMTMLDTVRPMPSK